MKTLAFAVSAVANLAALAVTWAGSVARVDSGQFEVRNQTEWEKIVTPGAKLQKLATGMAFTEGPVWLRKQGFLVFSDIPRDELKRWDPRGGLASFRKPSRNTNGNTVDNQQRLISCEHSGRRVSRSEEDGTITTLVDAFEGKKFNSPNDAAVKSDGTIWFTDPDYGLGVGRREYGGCFVFRFDPQTKVVAAVVRDFDKPNGICFSPDERKLYVADSGKPRHIRVFEVGQTGTLSGGKVFCEIDNGVPDGIRADADGRVYSSAGDGVHVFAPDGVLLGKILVPESPANLCFGGSGGRTLFITARTSLYCIPTLAKPGK